MRNSNGMEHVMITSEKRREIASRLRCVANDELGGMSLQKRLAKELELENTSWRSVLRGVADLTDRPTTTLTEDKDGQTCCANCGCVALYISDATYCPDCGAEVVSDDD